MNDDDDDDDFLFEFHFDGDDDDGDEDDDDLVGEMAEALLPRDMQLVYRVLEEKFEYVNELSVLAAAVLDETLRPVMPKKDVEQLVCAALLYMLEDPEDARGLLKDSTIGLLHEMNTMPETSDRDVLSQSVKTLSPTARLFALSFLVADLETALEIEKVQPGTADVRRTVAPDHAQYVAEVAVNCPPGPLRQRACEAFNALSEAVGANIYLADTPQGIILETVGKDMIFIQPAKPRGPAV